MSFNTLWDAKGKIRMTINILSEKFMRTDNVDRDTARIKAWSKMVVGALKEYYESDSIDAKNCRWWF